MRQLTLLLMLLLLSLSQSAILQTVNFPLEHWGYDFLERLEIKGLFYSHDLRSKPLSRFEVVRIVAKVQAQLDKKPHSLTTTEYALFNQLKGDLWDELQNKVNQQLSEVR